MKSLFQNVRALTGFVLLMFALFLTFDGFPGAMLSWLGGGVVMTGYTGSIATITHEDTGEGKLTAGMRILVISVGFAIASFGSALFNFVKLEFSLVSTAVYTMMMANLLAQPPQESGKISQFRKLFNTKSASLKSSCLARPLLGGFKAIKIFLSPFESNCIRMFSSPNQFLNL